MAHSMVLAKLIEVCISEPIPSKLTDCIGAQFWLGDEYTLGTPEILAEVATALFGYERQTSVTVSKRTVILPMTILVNSTGDAYADRLTLSAARETLSRLVNVPQFTLLWGPDGANGTRNLIFECTHAKTADIKYDLTAQNQLACELTISFDCLPYGRSDTLRTVNFDQPIVGYPPPPDPVLLDSFPAAASSTQATWWVASTLATSDMTTSVRWKHDISDKESPLIYTGVLSPAKNITDLTKLSFWFGLGCDAGRFRHWNNGIVTFEFTLTDNASHTLKFGVHVRCQASNNQDWPKWNQVSVSIPYSATFVYTNVTAYSITAWSEVHCWNHNRELDTTGYLCALRAYAPASPKRPATNRGGTYVLYDVIGSAPTFLSGRFQLAYSESQQTSMTGTAQEYIMPGQPGQVFQFRAPPENPNVLSADNSGFEGGIGTWVADALCTVAQSATFARTGTQSLRLTSTGAGTISAGSEAGANYATGTMMPVVPGQRILVKGYVRGTNARTANLNVQFYTSAGADATTVTGPSVTVPTGAFSSVVSGRVTAPASAAWARLHPQVAAVAGAGELYYFDDMWLAIALTGKVICVGAGGGTGGIDHVLSSVGGAASGEIAWEDWLDLTPDTDHAYMVGLGGPGGNHSGGAAGAAGSDSYFTGASLTVRGHGGAGTVGRTMSQYRTDGPAAAATSGSTNGHHFNSGAGSAGSWAFYRGGAAGGAAGDGGAGQNASSDSGGLGGSAGSLGIQGGKGGDGGHGSKGSPGSYPGGGAGGPNSGGVWAYDGSPGANGMIKVMITTYQSSAGGGKFKNLIVHKPPRDNVLLAKAVIPIGDGVVPPDGREFVIDQVEGQNARYHSTYFPILVGWTFNNGSQARVITVRFSQYETGGVLSDFRDIPVTIIPDNLVNGMIILPSITLPLRDIPPENTDSYFSASITSANTLDRFIDLVMPDTRGQTYIINIKDGNGFSDFFIDEPSISRDVGMVMGSNGDRDSAMSVLGSTFASGGGLAMDPGDNTFVVYSRSGKPSLYGEYWDRWYYDRVTV